MSKQIDLNDDQIRTYAREGVKAYVRRIFRTFPGLQREIAYEARVAQAAHARAAKRVKARHG